MSIFQNAIDALFEEDVSSPVYLMPAEIRNMICHSAIFSINDLSTISISETGKIVLPGLMAVSKQLHAETYGYINAALANPATKFEARVRNYNAKPLIATIQRIAQQTGFWQSDLVARTKVNFVGGVDLANVLWWVQGSLYDPTNHSTFSFEKMDTGSFAGQSIFEGQISLSSLITTYSAFQQRGELRQFNALARNFLVDLELSDLSVLGRHKGQDWHAQSDAKMRDAVYTTFAEWHDIFLQKKTIRARVFGREARQRVEDEHVNVASAMAQLVESLQTVVQTWTQ